LIRLCSIAKKKELDGMTIKIKSLDNSLGDEMIASGIANW